MKLITILITLAISLPSHTNLVTSKDLKSCINNCIALYSCKPAKGKKHAKKIQKKRATASVKPMQAEEVKACEKVTEYIFLPAFEESHRLPSNDYQVQRDTPSEAQREITARDGRRNEVVNMPFWNGSPIQSYILTTHIKNYEQVSNTIKLPKVPERGIPINAPIPTPLPASVFLFASGLAFIVRKASK